MPDQSTLNKLSWLLELETRARKASNIKELTLAFADFISKAQSNCLVFGVLDRKIIGEVQTQTVANTELVSQVYDDINSGKQEKFIEYKIDDRVCLWVEKTESEFPEKLLENIMEIWDDRSKRHSGLTTKKIFRNSVLGLFILLALLPWFPKITIAPIEIIPSNATHISILVDGTIKERFISDNQLVEQGDKLLQLTNFEIEQDVLKFQASLNAVKASLLQAQNPASPNYSLTQAKTISHELAIAQGDLNIAIKKRDSLIVRAMRKGRIRINKSVTVGDYLKKGDLVFKIGDEASSDIIIKQPLGSLHDGDMFTLVWSDKGIFQIPKSIKGQSYIYRYPNISPYEQNFVESVITVNGIDSNNKTGEALYFGERISPLLYLLEKGGIVQAVRMTLKL